MGDGNDACRFTSEALALLTEPKQWSRQSTAMVTLDRIPYEAALMRVSGDALRFKEGRCQCYR